MHRHLRASRLTSCILISCIAVTVVKGIVGVSESHDIHVIPVSKAVGCKPTLAYTHTMVCLTSVMTARGKFNLIFYEKQKSCMHPQNSDDPTR